MPNYNGYKNNTDSHSGEAHNFEKGVSINKQSNNQIQFKQRITDENHKANLSQLFQVIGLLRMNWFNGQSLQTINYGTAFAVSQRIILTCTHNIFSERKKEFSSEVIFVPNINKERIQNQTSYKSSENKGQETFYRCMTPKNTFNYQPLQEQLTLIVLQTPLSTKSFIKIGTIQKNQSSKSKKLQMVGYPSKDYYEYANLNMVQSNRQVLSGNLYEIDKHIIKHTMKTSIGMSGSPILSKNDVGQYTAVGIHTHKGLESHYNSGLFFNNKIIKQIQQFEIKLKSAFNLSTMIKYMHEVQQDYNDQSDQSSMSTIRETLNEPFVQNMSYSQSQISETLLNIYKNNQSLKGCSSFDELQTQSNPCLNISDIVYYDYENENYLQKQQNEQLKQNTSSSTENSAGQEQKQNQNKPASMEQTKAPKYKSQSLEIDLDFGVDPIQLVEQHYLDDSLESFLEIIQNIFEIYFEKQIISNCDKLSPKDLRKNINQSKHKKGQQDLEKKMWVIIGKFFTYFIIIILSKQIKAFF